MTVWTRAYLLNARAQLLLGGAALVATSIAASCFAVDGPPSAPRFAAKVEGGDLVVVVDNPNASTIDIAYPLPLARGPELGGVELEFRRVGDAEQSPRRLCASFDEDGIPSRRPLEPGARVEVRWDLVLLGKLYCLDAGEHVVRVTYVDKVDDTVLATPAAATLDIHVDD
ncbi:hypothetical protein ACFJIW_02510 [Tahibacter sp. UC22_41]|uniref:hypothetical protein n=1 Tax=Tahibacter sp. UC22_41 TaxID=3350178 RepID=UPI0036D99FAB